MNYWHNFTGHLKTILHHKNLVRVADGLQPVSDHQDSLIPGQSFDGLLQSVLILRVYIGGASSRIPMGASFRNGRAKEMPLFFPPGRPGPPSPMTVS